METILVNPEIGVAMLQADLKRNFGTHVSKQKVYRAKKKALVTGGVNHDKSYKKVRDYAQLILDNMP